MTLREFLHQPRSFRWGGIGGADDCTTVCATWACHLTGVDPAQRLRGTYSTREGAHAILTSYGGIVPFMARHLLPIGFAQVIEVRDGDIGVALAPVGMVDEFKEVGAIRFGPLWAVLGPNGFIAKKIDHVAAWGIRP